MTEKIFWKDNEVLQKCVWKLLIICCTDTSRGKFKLFDVKGNLKEDIDARLFTDRVGNEIREVQC